MNPISPKKGITQRYATQFKCSGGDCPDACCHGWNVELDRATYQRLQQRLSDDLIARHFDVMANGNSGNYAVIKLDEEGYCPFFDRSDRLCDLQKEYGESYLGYTCRQYPRQFSLIGDTLEMAMSLSCPEAARLCLLDDSATELVEFKPSASQLHDIGLYYQQAASPQQCYHSYLNDIREIILQLISNRSIPLSSRLFAALYFSKQISPTLHDGAKQVTDHIIIRELEQMLAPGYMEDLHQQFEGLPSNPLFSMSLLHAIILARGRSTMEMSQLIPDILKQNGIALPAINDEADLKENSELNKGFKKMLDRYLLQRDLILKHFSSRVDHYFENYSRNFWFKNLFIKSPSPLSHMQQLITHLAIIKFLFFCHPQMETVLNSLRLRTDDELTKMLDEVAVSSIYQFSRIIEHDKAFMAEVHKELGRQKMDSFAHLVLLLKF